MSVKELLPIVAIVLVAIVAFFGAFMLAKPSGAMKEYPVGGLTIVSPASPQPALAKVLSPQSIIVWMEAANETEAMGCRQVAVSEMAVALGRLSRNVTVVGRVAGEYCVGAGGKRVECGSPAIIVGDGNDGKLRINEAQSAVAIRASDDWLCDNAATLRDMVLWALSE